MKKLTASDAEASDRFGESVAVSGDTALVGAKNEDAGGSGAGAAYVFRRDEGGADNWGEVTKLTASDAQASDLFGGGVAVSGDSAVVGARWEGAGGGFAGAAYVFQRDRGSQDNWGEVTKLTASDAQGFDHFGQSVAVSGDTALVGAYLEGAGGSHAGAAYVFDLPPPGVTPTATITPTFLNEVKKLLASDAQEFDRFGISVAVSGDTAVVGADLEDAGGAWAGAAYVFQRDEGGAGNWGEVVKLTASDAQASDLFGGSVAVSGDTAVVGACCEDAGGLSAGAAYVFQRDEGGADNWGEVKKLTASDAQAFANFGSVAVSGDTAVVGASGVNLGGAAYVFQRDEGGADNWGEVTKLTASDAQGGDQFGANVAVSGDTAVVGASGEDAGGSAAGAVYVFQRDEGGAGNWGEVEKLTASDAQADDSFGGRLGVAVSGDAAVVGAREEDAGGRNAGAAYVFQRDEGGADNWGEMTKLTASDAKGGDEFASSVAVSGDTAVVGAWWEDAWSPNINFNAGAAYVFQRDQGGAGNWGELTKLTASDLQAGDWFGASVAVAGDTAVVGALGEDAGGDTAGAAYVFDLLQPKPTPPPVGGISLDSDLRPLPLKTTGVAGSSYGVVTLSIAIGAAVVLLAGIGWFATRRRPR